MEKLINDLDRQALKENEYWIFYDKDQDDFTFTISGNKPSFGDYKKIGTIGGEYDIDYTKTYIKERIEEMI